MLNICLGRFAFFLVKKRLSKIKYVFEFSISNADLDLLILVFLLGRMRGRGRPLLPAKSLLILPPGKVPPIDPPPTKFLTPAMGNCMSSAQVHVPQSNFDQDGTLFS